MILKSYPRFLAVLLIASLFAMHSQLMGHASDRSEASSHQVLSNGANEHHGACDGPCCRIMGCCPQVAVMGVLLVHVPCRPMFRIVSDMPVHGDAASPLKPPPRSQAA
jgi:hypothetical protein